MMAGKVFVLHDPSISVSSSVGSFCDHVFESMRTLFVEEQSQGLVSH